MPRSRGHYVIAGDDAESGVGGLPRGVAWTRSSPPWTPGGTERHRTQRRLAARNQELATLHRLTEVTLAPGGLDEIYARVSGRSRRSPDLGRHPMLVEGQVIGTLSPAHTDPVEPDTRLLRWAPPRHELSEEARDYVNRIIRSGQQSEQLISDLLANSRLSFENLELQKVDVGGIVAAAPEQVAGDLESSGADVEVEEPLPTAHGHRMTLVQVVANLLSNAVKFVPDEWTPASRLRSEIHDDRTRLWVEDNGIGIP